LRWKEDENMERIPIVIEAGNNLTESDAGGPVRVNLAYGSVEVSLISFYT